MTVNYHLSTNGKKPPIYGEKNSSNPPSKVLWRPFKVCKSLQAISTIPLANWLSGINHVHLLPITRTTMTTGICTAILVSTLLQLAIFFLSHFIIFAYLLDVRECSSNAIIYFNHLAKGSRHNWSQGITWELFQSSETPPSLTWEIFELRKFLIFLDPPPVGKFSTTFNHYIPITNFWHFQIKCPWFATF